uniref:Uncharacterized protein n=1 Tax=Tetraselmis sp. GSL018 TaxID=582737 RepID=A0A061S5B1_9CHLO|mmetsp:Transcript_23990/g.57172  ORF Transcript_23990/g.57172 Transcript_23990/m.57172 type:complete len:357 (-) Transcript_23990:475-1545(-)
MTGGQIFSKFCDKDSSSMGCFGSPRGSQRRYLSSLISDSWLSRITSLWRRQASVDKENKKVDLACAEVGMSEMEPGNSSKESSLEPPKDEESLLRDRTVTEMSDGPGSAWSQAVAEPAPAPKDKSPAEAEADAPTLEDEVVSPPLSPSSPAAPGGHALPGASPGLLTPEPRSHLPPLQDAVRPHTHGPAPQRLEPLPLPAPPPSSQRPHRVLRQDPAAAAEDYRRELASRNSMLAKAVPQGGGGVPRGRLQAVGFPGSSATLEPTLGLPYPADDAPRPRELRNNFIGHFERERANPGEFPSRRPAESPQRRRPASTRPGSGRPAGHRPSSGRPASTRGPKYRREAKKTSAAAAGAL